MSTWIADCFAIHPLGGLVVVALLLGGGFVMGWIARGERR